MAPAKKKATAKSRKPALKKAAAKKATAKKAPARKPAAKKSKRKASPALLKAMTPSAVLAAIIGSKPLPRGQIIKKLWDYIKLNKLQDAINKRLINADEKLKALFGGKSVVNMFEMTKHVSKHIK